MPPLACSVCEYAIPTLPLGRLDVVIFRAAGLAALTVMLRFAVALSGVLSASST